MTEAAEQKSLQGTQEIIQDHSPDTMARSAVAVSFLTNICLTCSCRPLRSHGSTALTVFCSHASPSYHSEVHEYTAHEWYMHRGHYGHREVGSSLMAVCVFVYHDVSWQSLVCQAKQPTSRLPYSQLDQIDLMSLLSSSSVSFS